MKKNKLNLLVAVITIVMMVFNSSCKDDKNSTTPVDDGTPVLNEDFSFEVNGNTVDFSTTIVGTVWFHNCNVGTDHYTVDGEVSVDISIKGDYPFTCNTLVAGSPMVSDTFIVSILQDDVSFCEEDFWKALTGGASVTKTWVLDTNALYFHNPIDFYGDEEAGATGGDPWGPWGGAKITDWMPDGFTNTTMGSISFDCATGVVTVDRSGTVSTGSYTLDIYDRDPAFLMLDATTSLWDNMLTGQYSYLAPSWSDEMADLTLTGVSVPLDNFRQEYESQFLTSDLQNVKIFHVSDSALVIRVKRTYEGKDADQKESKCWLLYNYIDASKDYGEVLTLEQPVKTSFTKADLEGTWIYAPVPFDWVGWESANLLNNWADTAAVIATGWAATKADLDAILDDEFVFNSDGSCTMNGVANTYSVADGKITFGTALDTEVAIGWFTITGTDVYVIDVKDPATYDGIWLGIQNGTKQETSAVHLIKKP